MSERTGVMADCLKLLKDLGIWHRRLSNGARGRMRFGIKGGGDILATYPTGMVTVGGKIEKIYTCQIFWIECKADKNSQSKEQKDFQAEVLAHGHEYLLARSVDDLKAWLIAKGVIRAEG